MKNEAAYYGLAAAAYGLILLTVAAIEDVLALGLWRPFDIASYYGLAASAATSVNALQGTASPSSLLLFYAGPLSDYRIFVVGLICMAGAMLVLDGGRRLYGGGAGLLAGLLFTLNIAGAQGYLTIGEALALALTLLSARALLFNKKYLLSGLWAGCAACFKPLALLLAPAALYFIYRKDGPRGLLAFAGAALLPLVLIAALALAIYGGNAPTRAADCGFEAVGLLAAEGYSSPDALMEAANIVLAVCLFASLLPLALLGYSREHGLSGEYFLAAGLCFMATILLRQYLHYWFIALPFLALLCAGAFGRRPSHE
jgi:hypothetical protein